jgi:hypothetical protein
VTGLDCSAAGIRLPGSTAIPLLKLLVPLRNLTKLQSLVLSGVGIYGALEDPLQPGLADFLSLRHLDLSHNPSITAELPSSWYVLHKLQTINISHTGVTGTLPAAYAALQQLREFRAVNCTSITGQLPVTWGLLNLQVLEVTDSGLTGNLPSEWADASALQRARTAADAAMRTNISAVDGQSNAAAAAIQPASDQPGPLGMLQLRVLDLSMGERGRGGLAGTLPGSFAAVIHLQVGTSLWFYVGV